MRGSVVGYFVALLDRGETVWSYLLHVTLTFTQTMSLTSAEATRVVAEDLALKIAITGLAWIIVLIVKAKKDSHLNRSTRHGQDHT